MPKTRCYNTGQPQLYNLIFFKLKGQKGIFALGYIDVPNGSRTLCEVLSWGFQRTGHEDPVLV